MPDEPKLEATMATYVYETIPKKPGEAVKRYEIWQSMKEDALTEHPETGEKIRRVMIGGLGLPGSLTDMSDLKTDD
jgi:predicted nucleic acid-binding Zn ribbon protein